MKIRGIRGAITVETDDPEAIVRATKRLLTEMIERNAVESTTLPPCSSV